ncbi:MAG: hypothetical protein XD84_2123 [Desulfotomaculum sp. 46_80]|nr:MAG: hypothetical protein XD84_2123 [Desulfotomaculum sp. 46_80]
MPAQARMVATQGGQGTQYSSGTAARRNAVIADEQDHTGFCD